MVSVPENSRGSGREWTGYLHHGKNCHVLANGLKKLGVVKGDRVCIYMPMVPEQVISMLACARIGAVHSVVFGGFGASALNSRIPATE